MTVPPLYKYRSLSSNPEFTRQILCDNQLYFASPDGFNDPFEFRFSTTEMTPMDFQEYTQRLFWERLSDSMPEAVRDQQAALAGLLGSISSDQMARKVAKLIASQTAVLSLSELCLDPLMWSHQADGHRGICIELEIPDDKPEPFSILSPVNYRDTVPEINLAKHYDVFTTVCLAKSARWNYEKEWRAIMCGLSPSGAYKFPRAFLSKIILGLKTPQEYVTMVQRWLDESGQSVPLYQVAFSGNTYQPKLSALDQMEASNAKSRSAVVNKDVKPDIYSFILRGLDPLLHEIALWAKGQPYKVQAEKSDLDTVEQNGYEIGRTVERIVRGERSVAERGDAGSALMK